MITKDKILKAIKKVDKDTFLGLVDMHDNSTFHAERCKKCSKDDTTCPNRAKDPKSFKNNDDYTLSMVEWIQSSTTDLDSFFYKKRNYIQSIVNYK